MTIAKLNSVSCAQKTYQNTGNLPALGWLPRGPGRILDCGCGAGSNAQILQSRGYVVTGITISPLEQLIAKPYCDRVLIHNLEQGLPADLDNKYDHVLMSHVLEHLNQPNNLLGDVCQILVPNGKIIVALPNVLIYSQRFRFMLGRFDYTVGGLMDETHVHFYTVTTGAKLLQTYGYRIIEMRAEGAFPLWKMRQILPAKLVLMLNRLACSWRPNLFGAQGLYLAEGAR